MTIDRDKIINDFLELVQIDAVSKQERAIADYIIKKCNSWSLAAFEDDAAKKIGGNCGNIIIHVPPADGKQSNNPLLLMAHLDTVKSTRDLKPVVENGMIRSSGDTILGADDRAGVAVILYLVEQFVTNKTKHRGLEIIFSVGEEMGMLGANQLDFSKLAAREGYILDCSREPGCYVAKTPTAVDIQIDIIGRAAHSAVNPEKGINAISMAADVLKNFDVGRIDENTVANIGTINGGSAINIVPDNIRLTGEIRSFNSKTITTLQQQLNEECEKVTKKYGGEINVSFTTGFEGFELDLDQPAVKRLELTMQQMDLKPEPLVYYGGSDANVVNKNGITAVNLGVGVNNPHSNDENIAVSNLVSIAHLTKELVVI